MDFIARLMTIRKVYGSSGFQGSIGRLRVKDRSGSIVTEPQLSGIPEELRKLVRRQVQGQLSQLLTTGGN